MQGFQISNITSNDSQNGLSALF